MNVRTLAIALVALLIGAGGGILAYVWAVGASGTPSATISAPTLDINAVATLNPTQAFDAVTQVAQLNSTVRDLQATIDAMNAAQSAAQAPQPTAEPTSAPTVEAAVPEAAARTLYRIAPANSLVMFALQEDLRGVRTDVVGQTTEVAGDIIVDFANPSASEIGVIRINARTLATDNDFRNRALRSNILQSANDAYEFIEFRPTSLVGLPDSVSVGETYTFNIIGDLTITGVTQEATFTTYVTVDSETQIRGTATATAAYADWGIRIPNAPGVANVTPDVTLTIEFTADRVDA
ncbi:MAG: YceI family protein [Anaerolineae bacterium]|nr:YceI family protein [Anaerolineae bacterium]